MRGSILLIVLSEINTTDILFVCAYLEKRQGNYDGVSNGETKIEPLAGRRLYIPRLDERGEPGAQFHSKRMRQGRSEIRSNEQTKNSQSTMKMTDLPILL
jgi:hypothetical protein